MKWILRIALIGILLVGLILGVFWPIWIIFWMIVYKVSSSYLFNVKILAVNLLESKDDIQFFDFEYKLEGKMNKALGRVKGTKKVNSKDIEFYLNSEVSNKEMKAFASAAYLSKDLEDTSHNMTLEIYANLEAIPA